MKQLTLVEEKHRSILMRHWDKSHEALPHIMNFSGGRSSGMLTLELARNRELKAERGDAVLFANTSAEHPATYEFANQVCDEIETAYGIPCFWFEFTTVEEHKRRKWRRYPTYKLVNRHAKATEDDDPAFPGYRDDGSVFEHMISYKYRMPDRRARLCTQHMKVDTSMRLLLDWFQGSELTVVRGHTHTYTQAEPPDEYRRYCWTQPHHRPQQRWTDFSPAATPPDCKPVDLWGKHGKPTRLVKILGLRVDEPKRVARMEKRNMMAIGAGSGVCQDKQQAPGEHIYSPLATSYVTKEIVNNFWREKDYDLRDDGTRSNCVYCFMKGTDNLLSLIHI